MGDILQALLVIIRVVKHDKNMNYKGILLDAFL